MALSREDKHDVKTHLGKALANKVAKVTRDGGWGEVHKRAGEIRASRAIPKSNYDAKTAYKNYARFKRMSPKYPDAAPKPNS